MTYSPDHVTDDRLTALLDTLVQDVSDLRRMLAIYDDAIDLPGRRAGAGSDHEGRKATTGPSRPTEIAALDESRAAMKAAVANSTTRVARAVALVRGSTAEMDRALGEWEGTVQPAIRGKVHGDDHRAADQPDAA